MNHRDWLAANAARLHLQQQWRAFFREWDVVIYPTAAVPAFPHDRSEPFEARRLDIDGRAYSYSDACFIWADPASTFGLPSTAIAIDRSPEGLPIGVQVIGPYLEDARRSRLPNSSRASSTASCRRRCHHCDAKGTCN
jgi:amidase